VKINERGSNCYHGEVKKKVPQRGLVMDDIFRNDLIERATPGHDD
jgi:hypothetical protein